VRQNDWGRHERFVAENGLRKPVVARVGKTKDEWSGVHVLGEWGKPDRERVETQSEGEVDACVCGSAVEGRDHGASLAAEAEDAVNPDKDVCGGADEDTHRFWNIKREVYFKKLEGVFGESFEGNFCYVAREPDDFGAC
jgi:hypothetical protein